MQRHPNYTIKSTNVKAYRLGYDSTTPDWFMDELTKKTILLFSEERSPFDTSVNKSIYAVVKWKDRRMCCKHGDYILIDEHSNLCVLDELTFGILYDKII